MAGTSMMPSACTMTAPPSWPDAFDKWRLDDTLLAEAFDSLTSTQRAAIKTGIALHYSLHGEHSAHTTCCVHDRVKGFGYQHGQRPMPWTIVYLQPHFAAGPRLVATLMPAILAGVPLLAVACVGGAPSAPACACLELMGVEHVFCLPDSSAAEQLLEVAFTALGPQGCTLFLGEEQARVGLSSLYQTAQDFGLRSWQSLSSPRLIVHTSMAHAASQISWCHPDGNILDPQADQADALFCVQGVEGLPHRLVPLVLGEGMEGFWCYQELEPGFFLQKSLSVWTIPDNFSKD